MCIYAAVLYRVCIYAAVLLIHCVVLMMIHCVVVHSLSSPSASRCVLPTCRRLVKMRQTLRTACPEVEQQQRAEEQQQRAEEQQQRAEELQQQPHPPAALEGD